MSTTPASAASPAGSATGPVTIKPADPANRDLREVIRDEQIMRSRILAVVESEPHSIPEIAEALGRPTHEVTFWVMGLRKYGWLREEREANDDGYYVYQAVEREL